MDRKVNMPTIAVSNFVKRQTAPSEFSHFTGTWEELRQLAVKNFRRRKPGYRDGVVLVPVPKKGFFSNIVQLNNGDKLTGTFKVRQAGEEPRKSICAATGKKMAAKSVMLVLYSHATLAENNEQSCDADWEIISINASPFGAGVNVPMTPGTLMANHFQLSGGTATRMSDKKFAAALKESVLFWKDKANAYSRSSEALAITEKVYEIIKAYRKVPTYSVGVCRGILDAKETWLLERIVEVLNNDL
jgi:hypothetical protein